MFRQLLCAAMLMICAAGCVHYSYNGESLAPTESVAVFDKASAVPHKYNVMGRAVVYGDYQDVSRERLREKLVAEAKANGADAVLITEQQVVPSGQAVTVAPMVNTMEATGAEYTYSMNRLQQDFNGGYGTVSFGSPQQSAPPAIREYRRILRAEFIRYTTPAAQEAPVSKK